MALDASILIKGQKQGAFKGGSAVKSRAGTSIVVDTDFLVEAPRDVHSGLSTGKRQYKPIQCELLLDAAYINSMTALATNEVLSAVTINFFQSAGAALQTTGLTSAAGGEAKPAFTIELVNAQFSSVKFQQPYSRSHENSEEKHRDLHYVVELTFQKITCTWVQGGVTFTDDWTIAI